MDLYERYLLALHEELSGRGVRSVLHAHGIRPRLRIYGTEDLPGCGFDNNVIAAALAGQWMLWWPWAEPIGPASQLAPTAARGRPGVRRRVRLRVAVPGRRGAGAGARRRPGWRRRGGRAARRG